MCQKSYLLDCTDRTREQGRTRHANVDMAGGGWCGGAGCRQSVPVLLCGSRDVLCCRSLPVLRRIWR